MNNAPMPSNANCTSERDARNPDPWEVLYGTEFALHIVIHHQRLPNKPLARLFGNGLYITSRRPGAPA